MKLTIIKPDGIVGVDGLFLQLDLSSLPSNLRVVQWDGASGNVEWTDSANTTIASIADYQEIADAWQAKRDLQIAMEVPHYGMNAAEIAAYELQKQKDAIAKERYEREIADLNYEGTLIYMDREARTTLEQTMDKIRRGVITESPFKCRNGWLVLNASNIEAIETAGVNHVANAFKWELIELQKLGG
jgi:hypothetical protein